MPWQSMPYTQREIKNSDNLLELKENSTPKIILKFRKSITWIKMHELLRTRKKRRVWQYNYVVRCKSSMKKKTVTKRWRVFSQRAHKNMHTFVAENCIGENYLNYFGRCSESVSPLCRFINAIWSAAICTKFIGIRHS